MSVFVDLHFNKLSIKIGACTLGWSKRIEYPSDKRFQREMPWRVGLLTRLGTKYPVQGAWDKFAIANVDKASLFKETTACADGMRLATTAVDHFTEAPHGGIDGATFIIVEYLAADMHLSTG